ncbi:hypothetical protein D3C87_1701030 [compost metagenome]
MAAVRFIRKHDNVGAYTDRFLPRLELLDGCKDNPTGGAVEPLGEIVAIRRLFGRLA